jgi:hypothetical protein
LTEGTDNNNNTPQKDERGRNYASWIYWSLAGILFYILSPGPVIYIIEKLKIYTPAIETILTAFYFPIPFLVDNVEIYGDYLGFWLKLAGAL